MIVRTGPTIFDALRFGSSKTLDLHRSSPTADAAVRRAEAWLRTQQVARAGEVLVITGRGRGSVDGVAVLRPAIEKLFARLRRLGVITGASVHTEGSFVVTLASVQALLDAPQRSRSREAPPAVDDREFAGLEPGTREALRALAVRSLESLGAPADAGFVEDEMRRQFSLLFPGLPVGSERERTLRRVLDELRSSLDD